MSIVGACIADGCGKVMQTKCSWAAGVRLPGAETYHCGRMLCVVHYSRWRVNGHTGIIPRDQRRKPPPRRSGPGSSLPADILLEDWVLLRSEGLTWKQAAPRIGVSESAMEKALHRARQRGDDRGNLYRHRPTMRSAA
jgi:hypothetical protein